MAEQITVNDKVACSTHAPTVSSLPELTISQDGHKLFAVMGYTDAENNRKIAIERIPRQFLRMSEEEQKWFLESQGIAKKLLKKLDLLKSAKKIPKLNRNVRRKMGIKNARPKGNGGRSGAASSSETADTERPPERI